MSSEPKSSKPKYPVGSLVVCEKVGVNTPCKVIDCYPISPINEVPRYRISSLDNPDSYFTVTEEELRGCTLSPKFKVGDAVRKIGVASAKRYIHRVRLNRNNNYRYEMYWIDGGGHKNYNGLSNEREEDYELWTDKEVDGYFDDVEGVWVEAHKPTRDNQTYTNEQGGKQSFVSARFDCIPPVVLRLLAQCLGFGARKYGKDNWKQIEQWDHLSHAMNHINEWNRGDRSEPHLVNAIARLTFALWQAVEQGQQPDTYIHPDEVK